MNEIERQSAESTQPATGNHSATEVRGRHRGYVISGLIALGIAAITGAGIAAMTLHQTGSDSWKGGPSETLITMSASSSRSHRALLSEDRTEHAEYGLNGVETPETDGPAVSTFARFASELGIDPGLRLMGELNCIACHTTTAQETQRMAAKQAPLLGEVGRRLKPSYIRAFLRDPHGVRPGTTMPDLFTNVPPEMLDRAIEPLVHFLVSMGGPASARDDSLRGASGHDSPSELKANIEQGKVLYHKVGCVACHEAFAPPSVVLPTEPMALKEQNQPYGGAAEKALHGDTIPKFEMPSIPIHTLHDRTRLSILAEYIFNPSATHPGDRMPSLDLTKEEAQDIADYLWSIDDQLVPPRAPIAQPADASESDANFKVDPALAAKGKMMFAAMGCAQCHEMGPNREAIKPMPRPQPFKTLDALSLTAQGGCLSKQPGGGMANYHLTDQQRSAISHALSGIKQNENTPVSDSERVSVTMAAHQCLACHTRGEGVGGPEMARRAYFVTAVDAELGDEGRLPPPLGSVGGKLLPGWLNTVISTGAKVRPYMAAHMPAFRNINVEGFVQALTAVDAKVPVAKLPPEPFSDQLVREGRTLVGTVGGMACINCHMIAGHKQIGEPAIDLSTMHERLRPDWFKAYMHDPATLRPGTRMPNFWPEGQPNPFPNIENGNADRQIDAIWAYLSLGEFLPLPEGLPGSGAGYDLVVKDKPMVFRTFITGAGARAIAVGFPQQVHVAFDAQNVRLAMIWRGAFLSAEGAWAGRGGNPVDPLGKDVIKLDDSPVFRIAKSLDHLADAQPAKMKMHGYRLTLKERWPIFMYTADAAYNVNEAIEPFESKDGPGLRRTFDVTPVAAAFSDEAIKARSGRLLVMDLASGSKIILKQDNSDGAAGNRGWRADVDGKYHLNITFATHELAETRKVGDAPTWMGLRVVTMDDGREHLICTPLIIPVSMTSELMWDH